MTVRTLRRALNKAVEWRRIALAPKLRLVKERQRTATIQPEQEKVLLDVAEQPLRDMLLIIFDGGMRPDEIYRMRWEDVQWALGAIHVKRGKTKAATRLVPMSDRLRKALLARLAEAEEGAGLQGWVFPSARSRSGHLTRSTIAKQWKRAKKLAGLADDVVIYCARHTFATAALAETGNVAAVMKVMGHEDVRTTMRYQHADMGMMREAVERRVARVEAAKPEPDTAVQKPPQPN